MHGRIKVRTTEEERERKKKENALKVKAYRAAMTKILNKRRQNELDDEMLQLSAQILLRNPDVSTLWNVRRECLEHINQLLQDNQDEQQKLFDAELALTEHCLMKNPKSYGAWHHRCWSLEHSPLPNWTRELQLCNKYLKLDERNFHTWDYRRYVVGKAGVAKKDELEFCTEKIKVNFSNYSSWHYRSQLLPALHPYEGDALPKRAMNEDKLREELEMVITAAFTDPNDSSAWFYQRWLLGYSRPELDICAFRCNNKKAVLAFTKSIAVDAAADMEILLSTADDNDNNQLQLNKWTTLQCATTTTATAFNIWQQEINETDKDFKDFKQIIVNIPALNLTRTLSLKKYENSYYYFQPPNLNIAFSTDVLSELESQLEMCNSLLEIEPDSKWTLLTTALLMRAIDSVKYHEKSLEHLQKLQNVDHLRAGYYEDLSAKWILEQKLTDWCKMPEMPKSLNLVDTQLNSLPYAQYLVIADEVQLPKELQDMTYNLQTF